MTSHNPTPNIPCVQRTVHEPGVAAVWKAIVEGEPEPAFLPRLLQRLNCQGAELLSLQFALDAEIHRARADLEFRAEAARARLLARRWQSLVTVRRVTLAEAGAATR